MNFVFFSPHFPSNSVDFCDRLKCAGAKVLGIGDAPYDSLPTRLKGALSEYYKLDDMENADQVLRALGHFTHKWGKLDRFESLNEHWLELEAQMRTDFNIYGTKLDFVRNLKSKSRMRAFFRKSGVATVPEHKVSDRAEVMKFLSRVGYPVVVKPDSGAGAAMTYRLNNEADLDNFFATKPQSVSFVMQDFVDGLVVTYDGIVDRNGKVVFASSTRYDQSVMEIVNRDSHMSYLTSPDIAPAVEDAGRRILEAFETRERFFHIELFETTADRKIIALEVNMRPPGAWITDAMNFAYDTDVYALWADMVVKGTASGPARGKYFSAYASRKDRLAYRHSHADVLAAHGDKIMHHQRIEAVFSKAMGNYAYQMRHADKAVLREAVDYIHALAE